MLAHCYTTFPNSLFVTNIYIGFLPFCQIQPKKKKKKKKPSNQKYSPNPPNQDPVRTAPGSVLAYIICFRCLPSFFLFISLFLSLSLSLSLLSFHVHSFFACKKKEPNPKKKTPKNRRIGSQNFGSHCASLWSPYL